MEGSNAAQRESLDDRKRRCKVYAWTWRLTRWIGVMSLENIIVGIANLASSKYFPWGYGLNLAAGILAILCCLNPVMVVRNNTNHPAGPILRSLIRLGMKKQLALFVIACIAIVFFAASSMKGYVECKGRDEYDLNLHNNHCKPDPQNLIYMSALDTVLLAVLLALVLPLALLYKRNKLYFTVRHFD